MGEARYGRVQQKISSLTVGAAAKDKDLLRGHPPCHHPTLCASDDTIFQQSLLSWLRKT